MYTLMRVRQLIHKLKLNQLFSTRQCLSFGSRGAVDQALYCLVKSGEIIRVTRGVFLKRGSSTPSILAVAKIKARSFGKRIYTHDANTARALGFSAESKQNHIFNCSGRSSHFRFGDITITFVGSSPKKLQKRESLAGQVISALDHLGKQKTSVALLELTYPTWSKSVDEIKSLAGFMPAWMNGLFHWARGESRSTWKYTMVPNFSVDYSLLFPEFAELFNNLGKT